MIENNFQTNQLIYGCMHLGGGWNSHPINASDMHVADKAVYSALETGIRIFDHADIYTLGKAQIAFGNILKNDPALRSKIIIQSKTGIVIGGGPDKSNIYNLSGKYMHQQVEIILNQLQTDYLDVLLLHRPDVLLKGEEIADTFQQLQNSGKVKFFGVSNMSLAHIQHIGFYWKQPLVANQIQLSLNNAQLLYNLATVNTQGSKYDNTDGILLHAREQQYAIQAWGALDRGKYLSDHDDAFNAQEQQVAMLIRQLADKYNTNRYAVVLAWLMQIPGIIQPVIGTTHPERIKQCGEAMQVHLSHEEWYQLWLTAMHVSLP
ncbi:MAG: aldo/keto reductase family oxidoreductase [Chitinophagales bacterium]